MQQRTHLLINKKKIRIVHIITGLSIGGAETMLLKLLTEMSTERFESTVVSLMDGGVLADDIRALDIPVVSLGMPRGLPSLMGLYKLLKLMREIRPHITQTWLYHADLAGFVAARLTGKSKIIWNLRCSFMGENYYRGATGMVIKILALLSRYTDGIIVNSKTGRELHTLLGYRPPDWLYIPNGFDTEKFKPDLNAKSQLHKELSIQPDAPLIGLIGRFDAVKGHDTFFTAAQELSKTNPGVKFVLAGGGCTPDNDRLMSLVPMSIRKQVHLLGARRDIPSVTAALDIANCLSIGEGFPNVVGEAMSCAIPCVVTNVGDCADIVGDPSLVIPPSNPEKLVVVWRDLLQQSDKSRLIMNASLRNRIRTRYSLEVIIKRYEDVYRAIVSPSN
jgi:glycosyltransferase involved in cell wall biosynthesis